MSETATIEVAQRRRTPGAEMRKKKAQEPEEKVEEKRARGRPHTNVETASFCCRAPLTMGVAYAKLARITGAAKPGTELIRAAEDHLVRMYRLIKSNPDSPLIRDRTGNDVAGFLASVEAFLKESHMWPLPADDE